MNLMSFPARMVGLGLAMAVAAGAGAVAASERDSKPAAHASPAPSAPPSMALAPVDSPVQDHDRTPGQYYSGIVLTELCASPGNTITAVPTMTAAEAFARYGITYPAPPGEDGEWQLDHLIPLSLGGTDEVINLWPMKQPLAGKKDQLENHLRDLVCTGQLPLETAEQAIGLDWQAEYLRYFGRRP